MALNTGFSDRLNQMAEYTDAYMAGREAATNEVVALLRKWAFEADTGIEGTTLREAADRIEKGEER